VCRFLIYRGQPGYVADWLIRPSNSLIRQSYQAREMPEPLNGDGFGLGWYGDGEDPTPCVFTSLTPAWSNRNLRRLATHVRSRKFFAHVRAATADLGVSEENCHPFRYGRFLWMHNGRVGSFRKIKRLLRRQLRDDLYDHVAGTTDSEHAFHLFLQKLEPARARIREQIANDPDRLLRYREQFFDLLDSPRDRDRNGGDFVDRAVEILGEFDGDNLETALTETIEQLARWSVESGGGESSFCNFAVTDGRTVLVTRWTDDPETPPPTLYYSAGMSTSDVDGRSAPAMVISSEPLDDLHDAWHAVPAGHLLRVDPDWTVRLDPIGATA
jgi:predicted glutamine amidotransferase